MEANEKLERRIKLWLNSPAELAIRKAMNEVESIGASVILTEAVIHLNQALNKVADYIDANSDITLDTMPEAGHIEDLRDKD